jgi:alkanesulfonate monooxygenase SsuD/methylene tetrahydromethanopterin reductase-like flavin-dependent oxidoreductase (luciferase family)
MDIGIGLPNPVPGTPGTRLVAWAKRAEEARFASLATIDRIAYPSYESLTALAAAAGATERIGLVTNVLLEPTRNPVMLAKEAASLDQLSNGRFTLGIGVGARQDDFDAVGLPFNDRGKRMDQDLELMHRVWKGELVNGAQKAIGPTPVNGTVPILMGGSTDKAIERTVKWGIGWTVGGAPPERGGPFADRVRKAWADAGREGQPKIVGLTYFGLGEGALEKASAYLGDYYGDFGQQIAEWIPKTPEALRETIRKFEDFGFDLLFLDPTTNEIDQIDRAAEAAL